MRFELGQKFYSRNPPARVAKVVMLFNDPKEAWVEMRDANGKLKTTALITIERLYRDWVAA
jgi:hypothetical protein